MIRSVVFDMGNVLREFSPDRMLRQLGVPEEDLPALRQEVFGSPEWIAMDRGGLDEAAAVAGMCRYLPARLHGWAARVVNEWWTLPFEGVAGMAELIRELKELDYGIYMLSNAAHTLRDYFPRIPGHEYFDGIFISAEWRLLKPQPEIYAAFLRHFGLAAGECFFLDDAPANVDGARRAGMQAVLFCQDMARLRRDLRAAGIPVRPAETEDGEETKA